MNVWRYKLQLTAFGCNCSLESEDMVERDFMKVYSDALLGNH